ncbi:hypothetical protein K474DRAFT_1682558 [Panus rudis PR-1116 ss-1]|nr:hypothetical protein K474DRAFT_1682558 [Panus rudis PR-1116 ss-1]
MSDGRPPVYTRYSFPTGSTPASNSFPSPTYTETADQSERVIHSAPVSPVPSRVSALVTHVYHTDYLEVNLGRSLWGLQIAAYGRGGTVDGIVKFSKKCTYVSQVTVKLEGHIISKISDHPLVAVPRVVKRCILSQNVTLFTTPKSDTIARERVFPFSISFPDGVMDAEHIPLPPSYNSFQPGVTTDIEYSLQVDVVRKGFHRHEMCIIPVLYLPKSRPLLPPVSVTLLDDPYIGAHERIKRIQVQPKWKCGDSTDAFPCVLPDITVRHLRGHDIHVLSDLISAKLHVPFPTCFASGSIIPVALSIDCPSAPAISQLICPNVGLFLVRRKKLWIDGNRGISVREQLVNSATTFRMMETGEGARYLMFDLTAGEPGTEHSFKVDESIEVQHFIRVIVRPPSHVKQLPVWQHDEVVELTTDQHGTLERELLAMDGIPTPALGIAAPGVRRVVTVSGI